MNQQPPKKPNLHAVPAILTGAAALFASLTAVYVNLRHDRAEQAPKQEVAAPAQQAKAAPQAEAPRVVDRWRLNVDRISVEHDGSPGDTDWRFTIEADDDALFAFQQDGLDDTGGRNVAVPKDAAGVLRLEGRMSKNGAIGPIRVSAPEADGGAFVFHLSADPADK